MGDSLNTSPPEQSLTLCVDEADASSTHQNAEATPSVRLVLRKPKSEKKVKWNEGTVDNEHMNKKKSKCCCIYKKPKEKFDESSSDTDDECENCFGHVEVKKKKEEKPNHSPTVTPPPSPDTQEPSTNGNSQPSASLNEQSQSLDHSYDPVKGEKMEEE